MTLSDFMTKRGMTPGQLAVLLGVHVVSVYRYLRGEPPSNKVLARIIRESGGLVGSEDFDFEKQQGLTGQ